MLSVRQRDFMRAILPRITIVEGCISSGKTFICNLKATEHISNNYRGDGLIFFIGRTLGTLEKNVLTPLYNLLGEEMFSYNIQRKQASLCGIRIDLEGCNDIRAETKIRGTTAEFIYGDELTLWNREFMVRCMGSLRTPSALFLGTTNPDTPMNFVKTDYLDRAAELNLWNPHLTMDDNPSLTEEYKRQVDKEYVGVLHDRFIKGLWVRAEGAIYPMFDESKHLADTSGKVFTRYYVSVDYGTMNPFSAGLWGLCDGVWYRIREYYHDGRNSQRQLTDEEYYTALERLIDGLPVQAIIIDPSAASFIACIRKHGRYGVRKAKNDVLDGIRNVASAIQRGAVLFDPSCKATIREFHAYSWDEKATEDKPIKEHDHCVTGDTIINTPDGDFRIDELVGREGRVHCYDEQSRSSTISTFSDVRLTQEQAEIFEVELANGAKVRATAEHPFLTADGWKMLKDITPKDMIICIGK